MDRNASQGRFYAVSNTYSTTLQSSGGSPDSQYRRHSSGSDSGSSNDGGAVQHSLHVSQVSPGFGIHPPPFSVENPAFDSAQRLRNNNATLLVDDAPYLPTSASQPTQASHFVQQNTQTQYPNAFFAYSGPMATTMTHNVSQQSPHRRGSGESSPAGSVDSQGSDESGNISRNSQRSASSGTAHHGVLIASDSAHSATHVGMQQPQRQVFTSRPNRYPAYDQNAQRIGMEHLRYDAVPHQPGPGETYYRPRTHTYPAQNMGPQVMNISLNAPATTNTQRYAQFGNNPMHIMSSGTNQVQYTRGAPLVESPVQSSPPMDLSPSPLPTTMSQSQSSSIGSQSSASQELPDPTPNLRQLLGLGPDEEVSLNALADPPPGEKPNYPYPTLIKLAIHGSPQKRLMLQEIYTTLENRFQWFRDHSHEKAWKNSIRHNLSLNKCFRKMAKPINEPGKGSYWIVDYTQGEGNKRARKRNKRPTKAELSKQQQGMALEDSSSDDESVDAATTPGDDFDNESQPQNEGHVVGQGRTRTTTSSSTRSSTRRANSPYAPPMGSTQGPSPSTRAHMSIPAMTTSMAAMGTQTQTAGATRQQGQQFGQVAFAMPNYGQPSFGQQSFGNQPPMTSTSRMQQGVWQAPGNANPGPGTSASHAAMSRAGTSSTSSSGRSSTRHSSTTEAGYNYYSQDAAGGSRSSSSSSRS